MQNPNGNEKERKPEVDETDMLKALRQISQQAHLERRKYLAITISVIVAVFAFRQFIPPVWMIWL